MVDRVCAVQGCLNSATKRREGVLLCKLHSVKEEKPLGSKAASQVTARRQPRTDKEPEVAPGPSMATLPVTTNSRAVTGSRADPADLAELMVELLQGKDPESALRLLASSQGKWQDPEFHKDLSRLAQEYISRQEAKGGESSKALRVLRQFVTSSSSGQHSQDSDPVITLLEAKERVEDQRPGLQDQVPRCLVGDIRDPQVTVAQAFFRPKEPGVTGVPGPASGPGHGGPTSFRPGARWPDLEARTEPGGG